MAVNGFYFGLFTYGCFKPSKQLTRIQDMARVTPRTQQSFIANNLQ